MERAWRHDRCILCLQSRVLTEEHIIPKCLGGRLTADFLCEACNSTLGSVIEAHAKRDPSISIAINRFAREHPTEGQPLLEGLAVIAHGPSGPIKGKIREGNLVLRTKKLPDNSVVYPTELAHKHLSGILAKAGADTSSIIHALEAVKDAPVGRTVSPLPGVDVTTWQTDAVTLDLSGPVLDDLIPVKIAFEWLALHVGATIYEDALALVREALGTGDLSMSHGSIMVESLRADRAQPLHGILLEANDPHLQVQIRLFGSLAYRVHFRALGYGGPRCIYTHFLISGEEYINLAEGEQPQGDNSN